VALHHRHRRGGLDSLVLHGPTLHLPASVLHYSIIHDVAGLEVSSDGAVSVIGVHVFGIAVVVSAAVAGLFVVAHGPNIGCRVLDV